MKVLHPLYICVKFTYMYVSVFASLTKKQSMYILNHMANKGKRNHKMMTGEELCQSGYAQTELEVITLRSLVVPSWT